MIPDSPKAQLITPRFSKICVFSANGALLRLACGNAPSLRIKKTSALKARVTNIMSHAFSAQHNFNSVSWAMPQAETEPVLHFVPQRF